PTMGIMLDTHRMDIANPMVFPGSGSVSGSCRSVFSLAKERAISETKMNCQISPKTGISSIHTLRGAKTGLWRAPRKHTLQREYIENRGGEEQHNPQDHEQFRPT